MALIEEYYGLHYALQYIFQSVTLTNDLSLFLTIELEVSALQLSFLLARLTLDFEDV